MSGAVFDTRWLRSALLVVAGIAIPTSGWRAPRELGDTLGAAAATIGDSVWPGDGGWAWHTAQRLRRVVTSGEAPVQEVIRAAAAELALGHPARARSLLTAHLAFDSLPPDLNAALVLLADAENATGRFEQAGLLYARAASGATGLEAGVLLARAADAFERGKRYARAAESYRAAATELPLIAGWLALREARVSADTALAFALLADPPVEGTRLAAEARAHVWLHAGDSLRAVGAFAAAGDDTTAGRLAEATGDTVSARRFAYAAVKSNDTTAIRVGLARVRARFPPRSVEERLAAARGLQRLGSVDEAARLVEAAAQLGDSSAETAFLWADLLEAAGRRARALSVLAPVARRGGTEGAQAAYRRARVLQRMGRVAEADAELLRFVAGSPRHPDAPVALYQVADSRRAQGRARQADSLFRAVVTRWPEHQYAGNARLQLATLALERGDSGDAEAWLRREVAAAGSQRHPARFLLARLRAARKDSAEARVLWNALARQDSLGYYGALARAAAGLSPLVLAPGSPETSSAAGRLALERLDLLEGAFPEGPEAGAYVRAMVASQRWTVPQLVELANGLSQRGWGWEGVQLGWQAAGRHTLNDVEVLRAIYPWPWRGQIEAEAAKFGLDPYVIAALIRQESVFRPDATSRAGARGLMQLMPATAAEVARQTGLGWENSLLAVPDANLHLGAAHLASLIRRYDGDLPLALAAYNAGSRPVARWIETFGSRDQFMFVERIPYLETRNYVRRVLRNLALYRALYPPMAPAAGDAP